MFDPRDDARDRDEREDGRDRVYDERGRDDHDPRDGLMRDHDLPYFDGRVHFPDYRIEYEVDDRDRHEDIELLTRHYRGAHAAGRARSGFRLYASRGGGGSGSGPDPRLAEDFLR